MAPSSQQPALPAPYSPSSSLEGTPPPPDPNLQLAVYNRTTPFQQSDPSQMLLQLGDRQSDPNAPFVDTIRQQSEFFRLHDNSPDPGPRAQGAQRLTFGLQDDDSHFNTSTSASYIMEGNELEAARATTKLALRPSTNLRSESCMDAFGELCSSETQKSLLTLVIIFWRNRTP